MPLRDLTSMTSPQPNAVSTRAPTPLPLLPLLVVALVPAPVALEVVVSSLLLLLLPEYRAALRLLPKLEATLEEEVEVADEAASALDLGTEVVAAAGATPGPNRGDTSAARKNAWAPERLSLPVPLFETTPPTTIGGSPGRAHEVNFCGGSPQGDRTISYMLSTGRYSTTLPSPYNVRTAAPGSKRGSNSAAAPASAPTRNVLEGASAAAAVFLSCCPANGE